MNAAQSGRPLLGPHGYCGTCGAGHDEWQKMAADLAEARRLLVEWHAECRPGSVIAIGTRAFLARWGE